MSTTLLVDESPFGTRVLLTADETPCRLVHHFSHRAEARWGEIYWGRAGEKDERLKAQRIDLGPAGEGFLPIRDRVIPQGSMTLVGVRRGTLPGKKALLIPSPVVRAPMVSLPSDDSGVRPGPLGEAAPPDDWSALLAQKPEQPGRLRFGHDALRLIAHVASRDVSDIVCNTGALTATLKPFIPNSIIVRVEPTVTQLIDDAEDLALNRVHPLPGGGRLVVDQTEALTAIDLDLGNRSAQTSRSAASGLFREALKTLPNVMGLMGIGGQVVLDLPRDVVRVPKMIRQQLSASLRDVGLSSIPAVTKDGLVILLMKTERPSLLDDLCQDDQATHGDPVRAARVKRDDVEAWRLFNQTAEALETDRTQSVRLKVRTEIFDQWDRANAIQELEKTYGPRVSLEATQNTASPGEINR